VGFIRKSRIVRSNRLKARKSEAWLSIAPSLFFLINLVLIVALKGLSIAAPAPVTGGVSLTCPQVYQVATWSAERYGGGKKKELVSPAFSDSVADKFLERVDPYKLMFTQTEVDAFKARARAGWQAVSGEGRCDFFEKWIATDLEQSKAKLSAQLANVTVSFPAKATPDALEELSEKPAKDLPFATNAKELKSRIAEMAQKIASGASPKLLRAYRGDEKKYLQDAMAQLIAGDEPVPARNLLAKAVLSALDPYSTYFSTDEFEGFYQELVGGSSGIGVQVRKVPQGLMVEKVMKGTPASRMAHLKNGDIITAINGKSLGGLSVSDAKNLLKGEANTELQLRFVRTVDGKPHDVKVRRESFAPEDARISHHVVRPKRDPKAKIAVIEIPSFYGRGGLDPLKEERSSAEDLERVLKTVMSSKEKPTAVLLDLRGNPGGFLEEAVSMAGLFIGNRPVVGVVEQNERRVLKDYREAIYHGPLIVLLDKGSASASEVLAGALKDHQRALVVGDRSSYGKGTVQRLFHLEDEMALMPKANPEQWSGVVKLTTSIFYSPLGHSPANGGITPHLVLKASESEEEVSDGMQNLVAAANKTAVPEERPFLATDEVSDLKSHEAVLRAELAQLDAQQMRADGDAPKAAPIAGEETDETIDEAASVAADFASIEAKVKNAEKKRSAHKNSPLRNVRRDVVGY